MSPHFKKMLWKITLLQVSKKSDRYVKNQEINRKERDSNISIFSQANVKQKLILNIKSHFFGNLDVLQSSRNISVDFLASFDSNLAL